MGFSEAICLSVKERANFTCCWCRDIRNKVEIHHIEPQAEEGPNTEDNAAPLCSNCHTVFGDNPKLRKEIRLRRDNWYKQCENQYHLIADSTIQEILECIRPRIPEVVSTQKQPDENTKWRLVYELLLPQQPIEPLRVDVLAGWHFAVNSPNPKIALYSGAILGIGHPQDSVSSWPQVGDLHNCRVECDIRISDFGTDVSNWVGFRVRGLSDAFTLGGYLVYLRANGELDIHRVGKILYSTPVVNNPQEEWTNLQIDIVEDLITVYVNGVKQCSLSDKWFGGYGNVYIHTFGTHALFRNLRIFESVTDHT